MNPNVNALPGLSTARSAAFRNLLTSSNGAVYKPGGVIVDGTKSRDPLNTGDLDVLRCGILLGKITATGKYAPAVIGVTTVAYAASDATMTVSAATAVEINRRIGASGTFKLTGPPTSGGTVRTVTVTYSAIDTSTGVISVTAMTSATGDEAISVAETTKGVAAVSAVDDVQTMTLQAGADGGTFKLKYKNVATAAQAYNVATADLQTALRALHTDLAACVVSGTAGQSYVVTTAGVACTDITITEDMLTDGGVAEPATILHTTQGVAAVAGVAEVQTITLAGAPDGGTFQVGYNGAWTAPLAYNVSTTALQAALQALATIGSGNATVAGTAGTSYVMTFAGALATGDKAMLDVDSDGLTGTSSAFVAGSLVQPTDGSETIIGLVAKEDGLKVTDEDAASIDVQCALLLIGGQIDASQIINYPTDAGLKAWVKAALVSAGCAYTFDDTY